MAKAHEHRPVAAVAGTVFAGVRACAADRPGSAVILEALGGCVGGVVGGSLPDWIEPATWPGHRSFFHSLMFGGVAATVAIQSLNEWESFCRRQAESAQAKSALAIANEWERFCDLIAALLWQIAAGLLAGLIAGYTSHLALDFETPAGLPIVVGAAVPLVRINQ